MLRKLGNATPILAALVVAILLSYSATRYSAFAIGAVAERQSAPLSITTIRQGKTVPVRVAPLQLITISGTGFDPTLATSVIFAKGHKSISVLAPLVTATSVEVGVPFNLKGSLTIQIIQGTAKSNVLKGLSVQPLPKLTAAPGSVTLSFLQGEVAQIQQTQADIEGTPFDTPTIATDLNNSLATVTALATSVQSVMAKISKDFNVAQTTRGQTINVNLSALKISDQTLLAYLQAQAADGDRRAANLAPLAAAYLDTFLRPATAYQQQVAAAAYLAAIPNLTTQEIQYAITVAAAATAVIAASGALATGVGVLTVVEAITVGAEALNTGSLINQVATDILALAGKDGAAAAQCTQTINTIAGAVTSAFIEAVANVLQIPGLKLADDLVTLVEGAEDAISEPEQICPTPTPTAAATPTETAVPTPTPTDTPTATPTPTGFSANPTFTGTVSFEANPCSPYMVCPEAVPFDFVYDPLTGGYDIYSTTTVASFSLVGLNPNPDCHVGGIGNCETSPDGFFQTPICGGQAGGVNSASVTCPLPDAGSEVYGITGSYTNCGPDANCPFSGTWTFSDSSGDTGSGTFQ